MLASYFKRPDNGQHLSEKLPTPRSGSAENYVDAMAESLNSALYGDTKRINAVKEELSGNMRVMDISGLKRKANELYLAFDYAQTADSKSDALDAIPLDICTEIHRNLVALNYAYVESDISMDSRSSYKSIISSINGADMSKLTNRYVLSVCTSVRMAQAAMYQDKDFGAPYMPIVLLLALKPLAGWETANKEDMIDTYAQSELRLSRAMASIGDISSLENGPFKESLSLSPVYLELAFGNSKIPKLVTKHSEELNNLVSLFCRRIVPNNSVFSTLIAKAAIVRVVHEDIEASIKAANSGLVTVEPTLPKSKFLDIPGNGSVPWNVLSHIFQPASFVRMECTLSAKYRSTGFPEKCYAYVTRGIHPATVPMFLAYSAEHLVKCVLIPSTEHAAAMIRVMYGLLKDSALAIHTPEQEMLLGYANPGYAARLSAKAAMQGISLLPLGKADIRQFLFGTEPRLPQDCSQDELFHIFA